MKIKEITLYSNNILNQEHFYGNVLGFDILEKSEKEFSVQIGFSKLSFKKSEKNHKYHYCFLIPSNKLQESIEWLSLRLDLIKIEGEKVTQIFENWNAESVYFYDGNGNIAEFIVRYDMKNETSDKFNISKILCVNEIGMTTNNIPKINQELENYLGTKFWKGDYTRFGTNGTQNGVFLLVNNEVKKEWFPTQLFTESSPFYTTVEVEGKVFYFCFEDGKLKV